MNGIWKTSALVAAACSLFGAVPAAAAPDAVAKRPVLFITIDGLRPDDVLNADRHKLSIPFLRSFLTKGAYAERVVNVSPSLTYPNHTTLVTGVAPAEHGITNNPVFDPFKREHGNWYSYYSEIKAPTLWHAAHEAGLVTASLCWPVTTHAPDIDYNIPEFGRNGTERNHYLMEAVSQPSGYLEQIEKTIGPYYLESDVAKNDARIEAAAHILIADKHPDFLTIHFGALDHEEHEHGPDSPQALAALETLDAMVGRLVEAERNVHPDADIVVASDHGFYRWTHAVNLNVALVKAGLITLRPSSDNSIRSWEAFAWNGGMGMIMLKNPDDAEAKATVRDVLQNLARDPNTGIHHIYQGAELPGLGIAPDAAFVVGFKQGYAMGGRLTGPLITPAPEPGNHGALTNRTIRPDVHSSLFIMGPGITAGKNLGVVDMRRIAPTIAGELGVAFPSAKMPPLPVRGQ